LKHAGFILASHVGPSPTLRSRRLVQLNKLQPRCDAFIPYYPVLLGYFLLLQEILLRILVEQKHDLLLILRRGALVQHLNKHLVGHGCLLLCRVIRDDLPSVETEDRFGACVKLHSCLACF
jgi:hypothetical protein